MYIFVCIYYFCFFTNEDYFNDINNDRENNNNDNNDNDNIDNNDNNNDY
jgi:hypothetical protein